MNKQRSIIIAILLFASSCSPARRYIYTASPANNPYFTEKGNSKLAGYYSDNSDGGQSQANGFDLQAGYAISNHIGIIASYYNRREYEEERNYNRGSSTVNYKRDFADVGIGYFRPINKRKTIFF